MCVVMLNGGLLYNRTAQVPDPGFKFRTTVTRKGRFHYKGHAERETIRNSGRYRRPLFKSSYKARRLALEVAAERIQRGEADVANWPGWRMEATDASGATLFVIRLDRFRS